MPGYRSGLVFKSLAYIDRAGELGSEREVGVVEGDNELALLVERVLEVDTRGFGAWRTLNGTLEYD